ncbi:hypothetical protein CANCADRAFT_11673, partial [Tortispora caseinolytica NRRL Y-17796]
RRGSYSRPQSVGSGSDDDNIPHANVTIDHLLPAQYLKEDVLMLIYRLGLSKWRRYNIDPADLTIRRISGALTNAVYEVKPPLIEGKKMLKSVLLRIYGPNVEHLIDREAELQTLARLAKRKIGPRLLGTFLNGRIEEFLMAEPLTKEDLRVPRTYVQIARRMRELHDGVDLTEEERSKGPSAFENIKNWKDRAKKALEAADMRDGKPLGTTAKEVLGTDFEKFMEAIEACMESVIAYYKGIERIKEKMVFAHNDAQYGNLLRVIPPEGSPLLVPENEHRQLVVIDFEYAGPNMRAFDIANHFCEWMSDFHDSERPEMAHADKYPPTNDQINWITAYVERGLDTESEDFHIDAMTEEIKSLVHEVNVWRPLVNAIWTIWGLVQAPIDEEQEEIKLLERSLSKYSIVTSTSSSAAATPHAEEAALIEPETEDLETEDLESQFDYLYYASQKAKIFWGDIV